MGTHWHLLINLAVIAILLCGIALFWSPTRARAGNWIAALALFLSVAIILWRHRPDPAWLVVTMLLLGSVLGTAVAVRTSMVQIPALVAFQHGAGAVAALLVSIVELGKMPDLSQPVPKIAGLVVLILGAATFSASLLAALKLSNRVRQQPVVLRHHGGWVLASLTSSLGAAAALVVFAPAWFGLSAGVLVAFAILLGIFVAMRVGGADMPVLISFLNAASGLAASLCGVVIKNPLLVAFGATVAASGTILTRLMCQAMNRRLRLVFVGIRATPQPAIAPAPEPVQREQPPQGIAETPCARTLAALRLARRVMIVPGYGMALAQAQFEVVRLASILQARGIDVKYAIHPVAGRMPGHMNVLLAEAGVPYDDLLELEEANRVIQDVDLAIVVGACDVVNPAAVSTTGTPLSGMPILRVDQAGLVVVVNLDRRPGYSGVPNLLYDRPDVVLLLGDAKERFSLLLKEVEAVAIA